jgi:alkanesulfonate monooxygenase SsuD/methylene tetrahydromethanopterin reductase-like flavin-dependent oxidoreductase (luciferase family)
VIINRLALAAETPAEVADLTDRFLAGTLASYARGESPHAVIDDVALVGTPDQIVAQLERYRALGVTHVFARLSLDEMPTEVASQTIHLFGRDIIPALRT